MIETRPRVPLERARKRIAGLRRLNAFIALSAEDGDGPVVAVKDLVDVAGMATTGGGAILPPLPARRDATVVRRLRRWGCVMVGKTNLHEWAYGSTSINPHFGPVRNPHDPTRIAGGSSGGSAVAVATGMCDWAIGTDTAGSLRIPASLCGVVSVKPTYGAIPMGGVIPLSRSFDTLGPMAMDVSSAATALWQMLLRTPPQPTPVPALSTLKLGRPPDGWVDGLDEVTAAAWDQVSAGLPPVDLPDRAEMTALCSTITMFEASRYHERWIAEHPERYGRDTLERLQQGLLITEAERDAAVRSRAELTARVASLMRGWDAVLVPATAMAATPIGDADVREPMTRFTRPFSTTGQPVVTIPAPSPGLPVGIQIVGGPGRELALVAVARALESEWGPARPPAAVHLEEGS